MVCHSQELKKERSIKELSVVKQLITVKVDKLIEPVPSQIELDIVCSILFSEEP
jgi:hypothetical protein